MDAITIQQAKSLGLVMHLKAYPAEELINTQWGMLEHKDWLNKERERIEADIKRQARIVEDKQGELSLWVNPVK